LVLAAGFPDAEAAGLLTAQDGTASARITECERFGMSHADAGAYLMDLWGLPSTLVEAIAFHRCPENARTTGFTPLTAVHVANALVHERDEQDEAGNGHAIQFKYLYKLGLLDRLDGWREMVGQMDSRMIGVAV
jgi:HD-like signal output (HDOD) protein